MYKRYGIFISILVLLSVTGCSMFGKYENPKYQVERSDSKIEIRKYPAQLVAEVEASGDRSKASYEGFRILADFIFGNNTKKQSINMTAPVNQTAAVESEKIVMTAPVNQVKSGDKWKIQFGMPSNYTIETLPKPNTDRIKIYNLTPERYVVIKFSGRWSDSNMNKNLEKLQEYIKNNGLKTAGEPLYAYYNDPFTPPFLRRNEVMLKLK